MDLETYYEENPHLKPVVKANELITKSRFSLSTQQQKIVLYLISQIKPYDEDFILYSFSIREFCAICGININSGTNYRELKEQIKAIADKSLWVKLENGKETLLRWIEKPYIDEMNGTIEIKLDRDMKPYLLELQSNFTRYELIYTLRFKSKYSIRLYEYLKCRHYHELEELTIEISLDELKERISAEKYTVFGDFHRRVLKPAIAEINKHSDKIVEYRQILKGKTVIAIEFTLKSKDIHERAKLWNSLDEELHHNQITLFEAMKNNQQQKGGAENG
jgi:plasmid replication initiation protein